MHARFGSGGYSTPDIRLALSYSRPRKTDALKADGADKLILLAVCALGQARSVAEGQGPLSSTSVLALMPGTAIPGTDVCIRNPQRRCLVIAVLRVRATGQNSIPNVAHYAKGDIGSPRTPLVVSTRPRWQGMPRWLQ